MTMIASPLPVGHEDTGEGPSSPPTTIEMSSAIGSERPACTKTSFVVITEHHRIAAPTETSMPSVTIYHLIPMPISAMGATAREQRPKSDRRTRLRSREAEDDPQHGYHAHRLLSWPVTEAGPDDRRPPAARSRGGVPSRAARSMLIRYPVTSGSLSPLAAAARTSTRRRHRTSSVVVPFRITLKPVLRCESLWRSAVTTRRWCQRQPVR